jgi:hypothetical protein
MALQKHFFTPLRALQMALHAASGVPLHRRHAVSPASRAVEVTRSAHFRLSSFD